MKKKTKNIYHRDESSINMHPYKAERVLLIKVKLTKLIKYIVFTHQKMNKNSKVLTNMYLLRQCQVHYNRDGFMLIL